jgi:hypothetical protein
VATAILEQKNRVEYTLFGSTSRNLLFQETPTTQLEEPGSESPVAVVQMLDLESQIPNMLFRIVAGGKGFMFGDFIEMIDAKEGT